MKPGTFDGRRFLIEQRLDTLSLEELLRIRSNRGKLCVDTYNYDEVTQTYCPMALALALDKMPDPTDDKVFFELSKRFVTVNMLKSVPGKFYHGNQEERLRDIMDAVDKAIEKKQEGKHGMLIEFAFSLDEAVTITPIDMPGVVTGLIANKRGLEYRVCYWNDGERHEEWLFAEELESLP